MLETRKGGRPSRRPDKETLQHLSDMLTIEQIAQLYCVDRSTVCNWKKYYRLPKIGRPTKRPSARKLRNLCKTCSVVASFFVTLVAKKYRLATMLPFVPRMVCDSR